MNPLWAFLACLVVFLAVVAAVLLVLRNQARLLRERAARLRLERAQHQRLQALVQHLPAGALYLGAAGLVANPALAELVGRPVAALRSEADVLDGLFGERAPRLARILARFRRHPRSRVLEAAFGPGGQRILRATAYLGDREEVWILQEVTRERRLFRQLLQAQKMESLGNLVGGVSHEFGNLLMSVEGCLGALRRRSQGDATSTQALDLIQDAAGRGRTIIRQLLSYARPEMAVRKVFDLGETTAQVGALIRPLLGRSVSLRLELPTEPVWLWGDPAQLHQGLLNLVLNARDAMPEGGALTLRLGRIQLGEEEARGEGRMAGAYASLQVEDEGCGIPAELLPKVFEPFFTTKTPQQGTGLGLAVTRGIVEAHGGLLRVKAGAVRGTCMELLLPAP